MTDLRVACPLWDVSPGGGVPVAHAAPLSWRLRWRSPPLPHHLDAVSWRSREEQECLWARMGPGWAARPGSSPHESGLAIDIEDWGPQHFGQDARILEAHGWCRIVSTEPWHYELRPALKARGLGARCK